MQVTRSSHSLAYYVGESDNVRQRLRTHTKGMKKKFQGAVNAAVVAGLKNREKSTAKKVEASLIRALIEQVLRCPSVCPCDCLTHAHTQTIDSVVLVPSPVLPAFSSICL